MARAKTEKQGPKFVQYFDRVLQALNELGGSGRRTEVVDYIATKWGVPEDESEILNDGSTRFSKNVNWARFYLAKAGLIDGSTRGVWSLTDQSQKIRLTHAQALEIFDRVQSQFSNRSTPTESGGLTEDIVDQEEILEKTNHRELALQKILSLPPAGFERLCQRLLRESSFDQVTVTGRSGDGGIDGNGILKMNPFVSFRIAFQCKRYAGSVGSDVIRNFRGSIMGRADKGIIMTTGTFTAEARKESTRDGATPIELVDGEMILNLLEDLQLGMIPKRTITIYEVDDSFFNEYR